MSMTSSNYSSAGRRASFILYTVTTCDNDVAWGHRRHDNKMFGYVYSQLSSVYPPRPSFTEENVPSLQGKTYIVTGANCGIGKALAKILYSKHAKVYIAARSEDEAAKAIEEIRTDVPSSSGDLVFLRLDLADLSTIKASAQQFLDKEDKLHVLFNNAGVMHPPEGAKSAQGYELQLGTNNVGPFLFTKLLTPCLASTAAQEPEASVRVVWVSSSGAEMPILPTGGVDMTNLDYHSSRPQLFRYGVSKAGNYLHAAEYAKRHRKDGIVSVALNPGNLDSELWRTQPSVGRIFLRTFLLHKPILGAYTELFAGLSPEVTMEKTGSWIIPWGRFYNTRTHLMNATKTKAEGGSGRAEAFWEWNEEQVAPFI